MEEERVVVSRFGAGKRVTGREDVMGVEGVSENSLDSVNTVSKLVVRNASTCDEKEKLKFFSKNSETKF